MNYFTIKKSFFLVPSSKCYEELEKIDKFMSILEKSGVSKLLRKTYKEGKINNSGRTNFNIYNMFAMIVYCFSISEGSLRDIENLCKTDIRVIYIMEGEIPDYSVIGRFINKYILPYRYEIFAMITKTIITEFNLDISDEYLDGTKLQANANKYKFVWKPTKFHQKLDVKIKDLLINMNFRYTSKNLITSFELKNFLNKYVIDENIDINNIPSGRGKRKTKSQKNYIQCYKYLIKLLEYEEKEKICGENRNSYYKTDTDATAMVLKADYYSKSSHVFHAGYNIQVMVSSGIITMFGVFQDRTDFHTFIPMNDLCADSGYGIYENYKYMRKHKINSYVKFASWSGEASGKNPQLFYAFEDGIMCLNTCIGEEIPFNNYHHQRNKNSKLYKFAGCNNCNYAYICKKKLMPKNKDKDYRIVELNKDYELLKNNARDNLLSPKGIEIRINRSIQVEGTFGQIKQNMGYDRIRRRQIKRVEVEIMLTCLGRNIRKLFTMMDKTNIKSKYWEKSNNLKTEKFPFPKQKNKKS